MPFIKTNDINLYYEIHGKGLPIVLVSGFSQSHRYWTKMIKPLSQHFQVIAFDNRGSGQSETPEGGYTPKMFVEDIIGLLDALKIENAHFMGESMGTLIIQRLCLDHRDRVKKVILCAPFAHCPPITLFNFAHQFELLQFGIDRLILVKLNAAWMLSNAFISDPENVKQYLKDYQSNPYPISFEGLQNQSYALTADLRHEIHDIPHQVLLMAGEMDITTPLYCAELMHREIPNSQMHIFKKMGHMMIYEIPEKATKVALNFLLQS